MKKVKTTVKWLVRGVALIIVLTFLYRATIGYENLKKDAKLFQVQYELQERESKETSEKMVNDLKIQRERAVRKEQVLTEVKSNLDEDYLAYKFPSDGSYYVDSYENTFYYDLNCTQKVAKPRFISYQEDEYITAPNGITVKALRLDTGEICYIPQDALTYLVTEEKWKEYEVDNKK